MSFFLTKCKKQNLHYASSGGRKTRSFFPSICIFASFCHKNLIHNVNNVNN